MHRFNTPYNMVIDSTTQTLYIADYTRGIFAYDGYSYRLIMNTSSPLNGIRIYI